MAESERIEKFLRLFTTHEGRLGAFAMSLMGNHDDAEDVLQEANLVLWKKFDQFQDGSDFMAWAGRVVYLEAQEARKRQKRRLLFNEQFYEAVARKTTEPRVSDKFLAREALLHDCVARLKPKGRELLKLRYEGGAKIEEMAGALGRSAEAVHSALVRLRKALFDCIRRRDNAQGKA